MGIGIQELTDALVTTEKTAESIVKLVKVLKQGVEAYSDLTGTSVKSATTAGGNNGSGAPPSDNILQRLAEQWSQLPRETRQELIAAVRDGSKNDNGLFFLGILSQMSVLVSMVHPVAQLATLLGKVVKNQEKILSLLGEINGRLKSIEMRLDEQTLIKARTALVFLNDAANIDDRALINKKLDRADGIFSELISLDLNQITQGTSGTVSNEALIALGYWGRHLIYGMQNQTRFAMVQVYECTKKYPLEGMIVFPPEYFSKDYKGMIDYARKMEGDARTQQSKAQSANKQSQIDRGFEIAGGVAKIGFGFVGLFHGAGGMIGEGWKEIEGRGNNPVNPYDVVGPGLAAESMKQTRERLVNEVKEECEARLQLLGCIGVGDLRKIIVAPTNI